MTSPAFVAALALAPLSHSLSSRAPSRRPTRPHFRMCARPPAHSSPSPPATNSSSPPSRPPSRPPAPPSRPATAKESILRYGGVYLGSSIFLSLISFAVLYVAIDAGVDLKPFLTSLGDGLARTPLGRPAALDALGETGSTFALAYIAHKATSPLRFPPTLVLTEVVAKALGKDGGKVEGEVEGDEASDG